MRKTGSHVTLSIRGNGKKAGALYPARGRKKRVSSIAPWGGGKGIAGGSFNKTDRWGMQGKEIKEGGAEDSFRQSQHASCIAIEAGGECPQNLIQLWDYKAGGNGCPGRQPQDRSRVSRVPCAYLSVYVLRHEERRTKEGKKEW